MDRFCWRGYDNNLPTCDDGSFRYWDRPCVHTADGFAVFEHTGEQVVDVPLVVHLPEEPLQVSRQSGHRLGW